MQERVRHLVGVATLGALACLFAGARVHPALGQTVFQPPGLVREVVKTPLKIAGEEVALSMMIVRPQGPGPFPIAILNHGTTEGNIAYLRKGVRASGLSGPAIWFARRGWAVAVPVRRGFGASDGDYAESKRACSTEGLELAGRTIAQDIRGALEYMRHQPYARDDEILSVGTSGGGWGTLALASDPPPGLKAAISFAGGDGSSGGHRELCSRPGLSAAVADFAKTTRVPELWIYSANDQWFWPEVAREMFTAYKGAGGAAEFFAAPASGEDGHYIVSAGIPLWSGAVEDFLRTHGLTLKPDPEAMAPRPPVDPPTGWGEGTKKGFRAYMDVPSVDKAFALGEGGAYAWVSGRDSLEDASEAALKNCQRRVHSCRIVSTNGAAVAP